MALELLLTPNPWLGPFYMQTLYVNNIDTVDFSGTLNIGVAKIGSGGRINIGAPGVPVYIDGALYTAASSYLTIPFTVTAVSGTYSGGTGRLFIKKSGNWVDLIIVQDTLGNGTIGGSSLIFGTNIIPVGYRCTTAVLTYSARAITGATSTPARLFIASDGSSSVDIDGSWGATTSGLSNSFSCSYVTEQ